MRLHVGRVAGEQLVGALADVHDGDAVVLRELGHEVQRHAHRIGDRLVLVVDEVRQEVPEVVVVDRDLVVVGAELLGDPAGPVELVELLRAVEADRERVDRVVDSRLISATLVDESTPPERNTPTGTSLIIRRSIERSRRKRSSASQSTAIAVELRAVLERIPVAPRRRGPSPVNRSCVCPGASFETPANSVRGGGTATNVR